MAEVLSGIPKLVIPDADALIVGSVATPELMALLNEIKRSLDKVRGANFPEPEGITPSQLADDFGTIILGWASMTDNVIRTATTIMPADNTKPQITEGDEAFSISYTPKRDDSIIEIKAVISGSASAGVNSSAAMFMAGQSDCLIATRTTVQGLQTLSVEMPSWGTTSKTFSVRHGPSIAGTSYIGSQIGATPFYDNATLSRMRVIERMDTPIPA